MRASIFAVVFVAGCAAAPPPPPEAPPPPPEKPRDVVAVSTSYEQGLALHVSVNGAAYSGPVTALPEIPMHGTVPVALEARSGVVAIRGDDLARMQSAVSLSLAVGDERVVVQTVPGTSPALCATILDAQRALEPCKSPIDPGTPEPTACDTEGTRVWRAERDRQTQAFSACFSALDAKTFAAFDALPAPARPRACDALKAAVGPEPSGELAERYVRSCPGVVTPEVTARVHKADRVRTFDAAFDAATKGLEREDGSAAARFVRDYAITGDPRLDELRKLGKKKLASVYATRLAKAKRVMVATATGDLEGKVCGIAGDAIAVTLRFKRTPPPPRRPRRGDLVIEHDLRTCGAPSRPFPDFDRDVEQHREMEVLQSIRQQTRSAVTRVAECKPATPWYEAPKP